MTKEEQYKFVAIELIKQWIEHSLTIMWEFSGNFEVSKKEIRKELRKWLKKIDSEDMYDALLEEFDELKPDEY